MSQKKEKLARQLIARVDAVEARQRNVEARQLNADRFTDCLRSVRQESERREARAISAARAEARQAKSRAKAAERTARLWASVALIAVGVALILGIMGAVPDSVPAEASEVRVQIMEVQDDC